MSELIFSHRPKIGATVGAFSENGKLFLAVSLVNNGTSSNGLFHAERRDAFSRQKGRAIVQGRIESMRANPDRIYSFGLILNTDMDSRGFMAQFRKVFKPTVDESDNQLFMVESFGGVESRQRPQAANIQDAIFDMALNITSNKNASV